MSDWKIFPDEFPSEGDFVIVCHLDLYDEPVINILEYWNDEFIDDEGSTQDIKYWMDPVPPKEYRNED